MTVLAELDTIDFHKDAVGITTSNPFIVPTDGLKGWWGGVAFRHESVDKPVGHGQFDAPAYQGPRMITVEGQIYLAEYDEEVFETAMAKIETVLDDGSAGQFIVHQALGDFGVDVRRHDASDIIIVKYGQLAMFQLPLWAPFGEKVVIP